MKRQLRIASAALGVFVTIHASAATLQDAAVWFSFTNVSGSTVIDDSGHGNNGTVGASASVITNGGPTLPSGRTLGAAEFFGAESSGNSVFISDSASMDFNKAEMSMVFWVRMDASADRVSFVKTSNFNINGEGFDVQKHRTSVSPGDIFVSPKAQVGVYNTTNKNTLVVGQWVHFACTWNWSVTNFIRLYVNGTTNTHQAWFGSQPQYTALQGMVTANWFLGWDPIGFGGSGRPLFGRMADFAVFTNTLSEEEIFTIYSNGVPGAPLAPPPPLDAPMVIVR